MDEYSWASAVGRIRVSEKEFLPHARLLQIAESEGLEAALASLRDTSYGPHIQTLGNPQEFVVAIEKALRGAYGYVMAISPAPALIAAYRARHDFHNLKAVAKSALLGIREEGQAFSSMGVLPVESVQRAVMQMRSESGGFAGVAGKCEALDERHPPSDCSAMLEQSGSGVLASLVACGLLSAYRDAMSVAQGGREGVRPNMLALEVDSLIDQAYYHWASTVVARAGHEGLIEFLHSEIDVLNLRIAIRAARLGISPGLVGRMILAGGSIDQGGLLRAYGAGVGAIPRVCRGTPWSSLAEDGASRCQRNESLTRWEKSCDDAVMAVVRKARFYALGPEPVYGFIYGKEAEARNLRIILSGKQSLLPSREIAERLRDPYV